MFTRLYCVLRTALLATVHPVTREARVFLESEKIKKNYIKKIIIYIYNTIYTQ